MTTSDDSMDLHHNLDPLANLSFFRGQCHCCGRWLIGAIEEERDTSWAVCECGHVFECKSTEQPVNIYTQKVTRIVILREQKKLTSSLARLPEKPIF
jgi:hypothetical protein